MESEKIINYINSANKYGDLNNKGQAIIIELFTKLIEQIKVLNSNIESMSRYINKSDVEDTEVKRRIKKAI